MSENPDPALSAELIEVVASHREQHSKWVPDVGEETLALFQHLHLDEQSRTTVQNEAISVLARCVPPTFPKGSETGLVIGYVQSGKTMSFTVLAALAHDNGFRLIIVITGTTVNLFDQSRGRLERDLRLNSREDRRKWHFFQNPKSRADVRQSMTVALGPGDSLPGVAKPTVLITVMKNKTRLKHLITLFSQLKLDDVPALIIDDEADQASLNNEVREGTESATYHQIVELRRLLPNHTFLQYTATPQALLLINIIDVLSPGFAVLLTPGAAYSGGKVFFEKDFGLVRRIPPADIPTKDDPLTAPPSSLLEAMRLFFLGAAVGIAGGSHGNRSMMIHPSKETMRHADFDQWVRTIQEHWKRTLKLDSADADKKDLLDEFAATYGDLSRTVLDLPPFVGVIPYLWSAVMTTVVVEVNTTKGRTPQPDWNQEYSHIAIGGEVLNRGYTIEGLTVSYMPRGKGSGNADTIQQRARWFGYKADYLGFCRVYLADDTLKAYQHYVSHEEDIRTQLRKHLETGKPLSQWRRAFLLSPDLRPTRDQVLDLEYSRGDYSDAWFQPKQPHCSLDAINSNRPIVEKFLASLQLAPDEQHVWKTEMQHHSVASDASLRDVYDRLLIPLRWALLGDSQRSFGVLLQIDRYLEQHPDAACAVYYMSQGKERSRGVEDNGDIKALFQGYQEDKSGRNYPGDDKIRADAGVSIQIWRLGVDTANGRLSDVPLVTVWLPKDVSLPWVAQSQGGD
jgi:hypothetical protein